MQLVFLSSRHSELDISLKPQREKTGVILSPRDPEVKIFVRASNSDSVFIPSVKVIF